MTIITARTTHVSPKNAAQAELAELHFSTGCYASHTTGRRRSMKTITINCPEDSGIISVVVLGVQVLDHNVWANQQLKEVKDDDVINIGRPDEEQEE